MSTIELRRARTGDERALAHIQTESWKAAFGGIISVEELGRHTDLEKITEMFENVLKRGDHNIYIELVEQRPHCIAGWGQNRNDLGPTVAELICIHSLQDKWHNGYGSLMLQHVLAEMKRAGYAEVILWVFDENLRARKFYEKHGFLLTEQKKQVRSAVEVMYTRKL